MSKTGHRYRTLLRTFVLAALLGKYGAQAVLRSKFRTKLRLPNTEQVADRVIALPFFNQLTPAEIREVSGALEESIRQVRRSM